MRTLCLSFGSCLALLVAACSPGGDDAASASGDTQSSGTDGGSNQGGSSGSADGGGGAGNDSSTTTGQGITVTVGTGSGAGGDGGGCGSSSLSAELIPVTMMIVFDKSGSMQDDGKWENATAALTSFVQNPAADGLGVGLKFFPKGGCSQEGGCDLAACSTPDVEPARLSDAGAPGDAQEQLLVTAIAAEDPDGGTPMAVALLGAHQWAQSYIQTNPADKVAVVLVTDGMPDGCGTIDQVASTASLGFAQDVPTYVVGLEGSQEAQVNAVAASGGTTSAYFIGSANAEAELLAALLSIQGQQIACELAIPDEDDIDPEKVNVSFTPDGEAEETIPQVPDAAGCGPAGGWYYDNPSNPTKITLCDATCEDIQGQSGELSLVLGCETIVAN